MIEKTTTPLSEAPIPPTDEIRIRLALVSTEAALLQKQLQLALRRDREAQRLTERLSELEPVPAA